MIFTKYLDVFYIVVGAFIAIYAKAEEQQNTIILIIGIVLLMYGLYRIASRLPSKNKEQNDDNDFNNEL